MKTSADPRHQKRIQIVKELFAHSFHMQSVAAETQQILNSLPQLDAIIANAAPAWPLNKVAKVDLSILRLAAFELLVEQKTPPKVIVDEAVEIAKEFGGETSGGFINGVLGTIIKLRELDPDIIPATARKTAV